MPVNVGSAIGYLDLDITGFEKGFKDALDALNLFKSDSATVGGALKALGGGISEIGATMTRNITTPIMGLGTAMVYIAQDFEAAMSSVKAISQATEEEFIALRKEAIALGASTAFSSTEVAEAMTEMAKAGWTSQQILDGMSGVLDAAAASGESLASVSTIIADAVTGFGLEAADSARIADLLTQAANSGTIGVYDLGESFKYIAPIAASVGISIEDTVTAISAMSMAGIKGSQAGTSLRTMLTRLVKPTDAVFNAMRKLGIEISNEDGTFRDLDDILYDMRASFSGLTEEQKAYYAAILAGQEGMSGLLSLMNLTQEEYDAISDSMENAGGVAQSTAEIMQDNLKMSMEQLGGAAESFAIVAGDILIPVIRDIVESMTELLESLATMDEEQLRMIMKIAGVVAAIGPVVMILGKLMQVAGTVLQIFGAITSAFSEFSALLVANPISGVVIALGALVAGLGYVVATNEEVRESLMNALNMLKESVQPILDLFINTILPDLVSAWEALLDMLKPLAEFLEDTLAKCWTELIIPAIEYLATEVIPVLTEVLTFLWNEVFVPFGKFLQDVLTPAIQFLADTLTKLWNEVISPLAQFIGEVFSVAWEAFSTALTEIVLPAIEDLIDIFSDIWHNYLEPIATFVKETLGVVFDEVFGAINATIEDLRTIFEGLTEFLLGVFTLDWETAWNGLKDIFKGVYDLLVGWLETLLGWFDKLTEKLRSITGTVSVVDKLAQKIESMGATSGGISMIDGSHANGLDYVPYDGYIAELHKGERVLTAQENLQGGNGRNYSINIYSPKAIDEYEANRQIERTIREIDRDMM